MIALGRLMLATLFLLAIWLDAELPVFQPVATYGLLTGYLVFAICILFLTWNSWWFDARLAGPAHAIDILTFSLLVLFTDGHVSPNFAFFMFIMLSSAIRWGWRATALTAVLLSILFMIAGLLDITPGDDFEPDRFIFRAGHLAILSLILIWFGASRQWSGFASVSNDQQIQPALDESPLEGSLRSAQARLQAGRGQILWCEKGRIKFAGMALDDQVATDLAVETAGCDFAIVDSPFLYDLRRTHALWRDAERNLVAFDPANKIPTDVARELALTEGLAIPLRTDGGDGIIFLERIRDLSTDHLDVAVQAGASAALHLQRHRLLDAAEENAEARSRLTLARDLHDSVVQFLAGAAFRLEAMKRSSASGRDVNADLDELKQLMLQEQRELRSFISSLRSGPVTTFGDLAKDLQALASHLSRQWDVQCEFQSKPAKMMIPTRIKLDAHQLMREAVANAVRHAGAKSISVEAAAKAEELKLIFINDGAEFRMRGGKLEMPESLSDRVKQAGGTLDLARGMGVTKLSITLPFGEVSH